MRKRAGESWTRALRDDAHKSRVDGDGDATITTGRKGGLVRALADGAERAVRPERLAQKSSLIAHTHMSFISSTLFERMISWMLIICKSKRVIICLCCRAGRIVWRMIERRGGGDTGGRQGCECLFLSAAVFGAVNVTSGNGGALV
uniref:Uncharacterized protein n=1 Tax=Plectus sambesii TaxID=2011161 RepID=A0A914UTR7_9BILA